MSCILVIKKDCKFFFHLSVCLSVSFCLNFYQCLSGFIHIFLYQSVFACIPPSSLSHLTCGSFTWDGHTKFQRGSGLPLLPYFLSFSLSFYIHPFAYTFAAHSFAFYFMNFHLVCLATWCFVIVVIIIIIIIIIIVIVIIIIISEWIL